MDANKFLIQCYFGTFEDPILASIDKAYVDMQTHTVTGDKDKVLFPQRKKITELLYVEIKNLPSYGKTFDEWHESLAKKIKREYKTLTYGQIQKWINMSLKYLYTLKKLGVDGINQYFSDKNVENFHAPIDSYVLKAIDMDKDFNWSQIDSYEDYKSIIKKISFEQEYDNWPVYAREALLTKDGEFRKADKGTYKRYIQEHEYTFK